VTVDVYNGTPIAGLSASTGTALARLGFRVHAGLNWPAQDITRTLIEYPPGQQAGADAVRKALPAAALRQVPGTDGIRVVLGSSGHMVAGGAASGAATPGAATPAASARSAAQAACS
jgi:hypothetical protein